MKDIAIVHVSFDAIEQAMELQPAKELAIAGGAFVADLDLDAKTERSKTAWASATL